MSRALSLLTFVSDASGTSRPHSLRIQSASDLASAASDHLGTGELLVQLGVDVRLILRRIRRSADVEQDLQDLGARLRAEVFFLDAIAHRREAQRRPLIQPFAVVALAARRRGLLLRHEPGHRRAHREGDVLLAGT